MSNGQPVLDQPGLVTIGYHIRPGEHDLTEYDWLQFLDFAGKHLVSLQTWQGLAPNRPCLVLCTRLIDSSAST
jgi:hypothetical protein